MPLPWPRRRRRRLGLAAAAALIPLLAAAGAAWLVSRHGAAVVTDGDAAPSRAVVIVPGAHVHRDGAPSAVLEDRLACALDVWRAGKVARVLVSGDHGRPGYDEVNAMRAWLVARGVPSEVVFMDHAGLRTTDTMQRAARVFGARGALVCTQRVHMARTLYLARAAGLDAVGVVADRQPYGNARAQALRERAAAVLAVWDVAVGRAPRHLGAAVPLDGPAAATHDRWTAAATVPAVPTSGSR